MATTLLVPLTNVDKAFNDVNRKNFVPEERKPYALLDVPLPIGYGQTISQPSTVQMMLEWLNPKPGQKILDVGSGSGWTTALLANAVGPKGYVYAVEKVPELVKFGEKNIRRQGIENATIFKAGKEHGLSEFAPYDRILVSAAAKEVPEELQKQLKDGGKLVIPVGNDILELIKFSSDNWDVRIHSGFVFVPLV